MKKKLVEVDVDLSVAKGEAEMTSWNAVANVAERMLSRLGRFSFLTLMILSLAAGTSAIAAEDFQLWKNSTEKALERIDEDGTKQAVNWMVAKPDFNKFVESFASEPFKFVEGFKAGMLEGIKKNTSNGKLDKAGFKKFTDALEKSFGDVKADKFGGRLEQAAFKELMEKMLTLSKEELEDEDFLKELFEKAGVLGALDLTDKDPEAEKKKEEEEKTAKKEEEKGAKEDENANKGALEEKVNQNADLSNKAKEIAGVKNEGENLGDDNKNIVDNTQDSELDARLRAEQARNAQMQQIINSLRSQRVQQPTGELDDSALARTAQTICDKFNALDRDREDDLANQLDPIKDALNQGFNQLEALSRRPIEAAQNNGGERLEDILPGLLANALGDEGGNEQAIQPPQPPQAASIPPQSNNDRGNENFLPPPPPAREEQPLDEPQPQPLPFFPTANRAPVTAPITLDLPSTSGRQELRDAEDMLGVLEGRTPVAQNLGQNAQLPELVMAKSKVSAESKQAQATLQTAKDKAAILDEQLEQLKEGGRAALPPSVKRQEAELQNEIQRHQKRVEQIQQMAQQAGENPAAAQALQQQMQQAQAQQQQAEEALTKFRAEKEIKIEEGNKKIKALAKQRDRLNSAVSKLQGQVNTLKEEEQAVQQLINQRMNLELAAIQAQFGAQQQQSTTTPNVNRIQQFGSATGGAPRTVPPSQINGLGGSAAASGTQSGSTVPTSGNVQRGSLR